MENKTTILYMILVLVLLLCNIFMVSYWFDTLDTLKNPCKKCLKIMPEIGPCLIGPIPNNEKIDLDLIEGFNPPRS